MKYAVLVVAIVAAVVNWAARARRSNGLEAVSKPLTTMLVMLVALVGVADDVQTATAFGALALCLIGDIALMQMFDAFVVGLTAFLLGHLVFISLFFQYGFDSPPLAAAAVVLAGALAATIGKRIVEGAGEHEEWLRIPVGAYLTVISVMTIAGWATGRWYVVGGTLLFVVSDSILGWERFVRSQKWMPLAVMITYHGAIGLLAVSLW